MREWMSAIMDLEWKLLIPQPFVTTIGLIIDNYSKILGAIILMMQIAYLYMAIQEKRRNKRNDEANTGGSDTGPDPG